MTGSPLAERTIAANRLYRAHRAVIEQHTVQHRWVCAGRLRVPDGALELDEAPGQVFLHYGILDPLTIALGDTATVEADALLTTFPGLEGVTDDTSGASLTHTHLWSLPVQFTPPQPGDRVAVLVMKTRSDDAFDAESYTEAWVLGRLVMVDIVP